jgi:DNA polymerase-3 subunit delta'
MARAPVVRESESEPEADRLEGFAHPRDNQILVGHDEAAAAFASQFGTGRTHHAWLIAGREGIGKATLAYHIARYALASPLERSAGAGNGWVLGVPPTSTAARQVRAMSHPGLLVIRRPWDQKAKRFIATIPVDEVRRLKSFLAHSAGQDAWRVVIVDQADELNTNAANALLKSLEEPPARALFLLVTSQPGRLLPTIRSRCRRLDLAPLGPTELKHAATAAIAAAGGDAVADDRWPTLIAGAQGSVRRLLALTRSDGAGVQGKVGALIATLPKLDWLQVHALADEITGPGAEQRFEQFFVLLMDEIARLVRTQVTGVGAPDTSRLAARIVGGDGVATWAELWETVTVRKAEAAALNLDRKALILETFAQMQTAAGG